MDKHGPYTKQDFKLMEKHGTDVSETLAERETQHGPFNMHAALEGELQDIVKRNDSNLTVVQRVGLNMIMHKIARILNKGHNHSDTWHDIAGYATLVERDILSE